METSVELTASSVFWWADQSAGWIYLLPPLETRHVLCIDPLPEISWLMHYSCARITVAYTSEARADEAGRRQTSAGDRIDWIPFDDFVAGMVARGTRFDGLVIHDPQARIVHSASKPAVSRLAAALPALLTDDAFVYLGLKRRLSLFGSARDSRAPRGSHPLWSPRRIIEEIRAQGFDTLHQTPYLLDGTRVLDILVPAYRATTNGHLWRERLKERLLGPTSSRWLAPAIGYVVTRDGAPPSVLEEIRALVGRISGSGPETLSIDQFRLARGDKAILCFRPPEPDSEAVIAVVTEDPAVFRGRRIELDILERLSRLPEHIASRVPRHLGEHRIGRYTCFMMSAFDGVTLDADSDHLAPLTRQAMDFLTGLQVETAMPTTLDAAALDLHVSSIFEDAIARNPSVAAELRALAEQVRQQLAGHTLPTVLTHGDFKIENVMYSSDDGLMTGVIDWEHATAAALPLIDPLYLMLYNRTLRGATWLDALEAMLDESTLATDERSLLRRHMEILGVPISNYPALTALFFAHHIGRRITLDPDSTVERRLSHVAACHASRMAGGQDSTIQKVS